MNETQTEMIFAWKLSLKSGNTRRAYDRIIDSFLEHVSPKPVLEVGPPEIGIHLRQGSFERVCTARRGDKAQSQKIISHGGILTNL